MPHILQDSGVREDVGDHVAEVAAIVNNHRPWVVDIEELQTSLDSEKHLPYL